MCHADAYFALGKSHTVCQDYAATGKVDGTVLAAVADGCSSSPDTDFGARFLVKTRLTGLWPPAPANLRYFVQMADTAARSLALSNHCLDATLLHAEVTGDDLTVVAYGDGVIDLEFKNGDRNTFSIEFEGEAPAYLSYWLREDDLDLYLRKLGQRKVTVKSQLSDRMVWENTGEVKVTRDAYGFVQNFPWNTIKRVTLCTDGVRSFRKVTAQGATEDVPLDSVLAEVTGIKSQAGQFMVRRMRRFLYDYCPKNGWYHDDDVGVATILNGEVPGA